MELFQAAKECGVDAVKLQKRDNRGALHAGDVRQAYDNENSFGATYGEHREALEFGRRIRSSCSAMRASSASRSSRTAFDMPSADFLAELDVPAYKIASGDLVNTPLLQHVATYRQADDRLHRRRHDGGRRSAPYDAIMPINPQLCVLQCTAAYPAEAEDLNLRVIATYCATSFPDVVIGLSDHDNGIAMALAAYVLGARVIEKHFTLNRAMEGHRPRLLARAGRHAASWFATCSARALALGDGVKRPYPSEESAAPQDGQEARRRARPPAGHVLAPGDVDAKSPGDGGLPPYELDRMLGRRLTRSLTYEENVTFEDLAPAEEPLAAPGGVAER